MNSKFELTIFVPTYNCEKYLEETLLSISNQSYQNYNLVIVDNCSTDKTIEIAENCANFFKSFQIVQNEKNLGWDGNSNKCISLCETEYMAIYHADDLYDPKIIEVTLNFLKQNDYFSAVGSLGVAINNSKEVLFEYKPSVEKNSEHFWSFDFEKLFEYIIRFGNNMFICPSFMFRTSELKKTNGFEGRTFGGAADVALWLEISKSSKISILPDKLIKYRIHDDQASATVLRKIASFDPILKVVKSYSAYSKPKSELYNFMVWRIFVLIIKRALRGDTTYYSRLNSIISNLIGNMPFRDWSRQVRIVYIFLKITSNKSIFALASKLAFSLVLLLKKMGFLRKRLI